jgi:LPXTG-site transpeptidase (sortase) family protein
VARARTDRPRGGRAVPLLPLVGAGLALAVFSTALGVVLTPTARPAPDAGPASLTGASPSGPPASSGPRESTPAPPPTGPAGPPVRVRLPALDVVARVQPVRPTGNVLTPPADARRLGWWRDGARPGDGAGRVLVTGHTVSTGGGAFDRLHDLRRGDVVVVRTAGGGRRSYQVKRTRYLTVEEFAARAERLLRQRGPERLVLVTCDGWDGTSYEGSTVVVAVPATVSG